MNKKILGIKISAIVAFAGCLAVAVLVWLIVKYIGGDGSDATASLLRFLPRG